MITPSQNTIASGPRWKKIHAPGHTPVLIPSYRKTVEFVVETSNSTTLERMNIGNREQSSVLLLLEQRKRALDDTSLFVLS
jgi:hypothetical protein